ncbi:hypothetical protein [Lacticaseibacillus hulanensis]|uniref:hypothetical protein n=1 Tax=Lacticaseibacillus hulanensis TaxID=2493111 RepID=UPI000FD7AFA1|nr:hypothetical protein [Lacticaseibacillus hulanensis]
MTDSQVEAEREWTLKHPVRSRLQQVQEELRIHESKTERLGKFITAEHRKDIPLREYIAMADQYQGMLRMRDALRVRVKLMTERAKAEDEKIG